MKYLSDDYLLDHPLWATFVTIAFGSLIIIIPLLLGAK